MLPFARGHFQSSVQENQTFYIDSKRIPAAPPPYEDAWYEYRDKEKIFGSYVHTLGMPVAPPNSDPELLKVLEGARWTQVVTSFIETPSMGIRSNNSCSIFYLDQHGGFIACILTKAGGVAVGYKAQNDYRIQRSGLVATAYGTDALALFFQGLLACKNVEINSVCPPKALCRKHERRYGTPYVRYHTLRILVPGTKRYVDLDETKRISTDPAPLGLHLVRGHFKTYTEEHALFGRIVGSFYWPPHLRGSLDAGVIGKHYEELPA
jgi:hypothetical protein